MPPRHPAYLHNKNKTHSIRPDKDIALSFVRLPGGQSVTRNQVTTASESLITLKSMNRHRNKHSTAANNSWLLDITYAVLRIACWMMGNDLQLKPVPVVVRKEHRAGLTRHPDSRDSFGIPRFSLFQKGPPEATERRIPRQVSTPETRRHWPGKQ